jgi:putative two-component system response regulator
MPGMDGYEVIIQLKKNERTAHIPVLFLTAKNSEIDEEIGLRLGAVDFISKPIRPAIVLQRIKIHLDLSERDSTVPEHVEVIEPQSAVQDPDG